MPRFSYFSPAEDGSVRTTGKTASKADNPYANVGWNAPGPCARVRSSRCVTDGQAPFSGAASAADLSPCEIAQVPVMPTRS